MTKKVKDYVADRMIELFGYGPRLWEVCDKCNYNNHRCYFCGDDLTHAEDHNGTHIRECRPDLFNEDGTVKDEGF